MRKTYFIYVEIFFLIFLPFMAFASYINPPGVDGLNASLGKHFKEKGIDANNDGKLEALIITVPVDIKSAGTYYLLGSLRALSESPFIGSVDRTITLPIGEQDIELKFDGTDFRRLRKNGPYTLSVFLGGKNSLESSDDIYKTASYKWEDFQPLHIEISGSLFEKIIRNQKSNLIEQLEIRVPVKVLTAQEITADAWIRTVNNVFIDTVSFTHFFPAGENEISFKFSGLKIGMLRENGPYIVDIKLTKNGKIIDAVNPAYRTKKYNFTDFIRGGSRFISLEKWVDRGVSSFFAPKGKFTKVQISIFLEVKQKGKYSVVASLFDDSGKEFICAANVALTEYKTGVSLLILNFSAKTIAKKGLAGPYKLRYLFLFDEKGFLIDRLEDYYQTKAYKPEEFIRP